MRKILSLFILLVASGCVSTMESIQMANTQNILVQTPHVEGAECKISDKGGRTWKVRETPDTIAIKEGHPPLVIICSKNGFKTSILTINEHKEELLTIDGKRIDVSVFGDFPTKFPRLIPSAVKETVGFAQDPTGSLSTTYPNAVTVWMEPKKWQSEEQMREWAFDRQVADRAEFINEEDAKRVDEERRAKRRADKDTREKKFQNFTKNLKKGVNPAEPLKKGFTNSTKIIDPVHPVERAIEEGFGNPVAPVGKAVGKGMQNMATPVEKLMDEGIGKSLPSVSGSSLDAINPTKIKDNLNKRTEIKEQTRQQRALDDAARKAKDDGKYPPMEEDSVAPQDIFNSNGTGGSRYKKVYNNEDAKYDENGNRIAK